MIEAILAGIGAIAVLLVVAAIALGIRDRGHSYPGEGY